MVIALLKVSRRFPIPVRSFLADTIALAGYLGSPGKQSLRTQGLRNAAIERLDDKQLRATLRGAAYRFWRETFWMAPSSTEVELIRSMPLRGEEHLQQALGRGKGVLLLESNNFGSRIMARRILHSRGYALHQVHMAVHLGSGFVLAPKDRDWSSRMLGRYFERCEKEFLEEIIYLPATESMAFTRTMMDRLKQNCIICLAGDGRYGQRLIEAPFLGIPKTFSTGMISLARSSGATVLPLFCLGDGYSRFAAIIEAPIDVATSPQRDASIAAAIVQFSEVLGKYASQYKDQFSGWDELAIPPPTAADTGPG